MSTFSIQTYVAVCSVGALALGCGDSSSPSGPATVGGTLSGVVWTEGGNIGWPIDTSSFSAEPITAGFTETPDAFHASSSGVWMGYSDGRLFGMDTDGNNLQGPFSVGPIGPDVVLSLPTEVWMGASRSDRGPIIFDIASETFTEVPGTVDEIQGSFAGIRADNDAVYVLYDSQFRLAKIDRSSKTLSVLTDLGEDPSNPTGPRGDFFGLGLLGVDADWAWVLDTSVYKLHRLDKNDLSIDNTVDLSSRIPEASDGGAMALVIGATNVYVANRDNGSDQSDILFIDRDTMEVSNTLTTEESILDGIAINGDQLLFEATGSAEVVDGTTGSSVGPLAFPLDGDPTIWLP